MRPAFIVAAGLLTYGAWIYMRQQESVAVDAENLGIFDTLTAAADEAVTLITSGFENMNTDPASALGNRNVQSFLMLIRTGEGTADQNGYRRMYGGRLFDSFADHPRVKITAGNWTSTAAGAYQFLSRTWDECRAALKLGDFSPANQDLAAVYLIRRRGALVDVIAGRFETAIRKCNKEWASLPESPYGQPTLSMGRALDVLAANGGASYA